MTGTSRRMRWVVLLLAMAACGGKDSAKDEEPKAAPAPAGPTAGYETSWVGYVSKTFPGTLDDNAEAVASALRALDLEITEERGGLFEKNLEAEGGDTSLVVSVKEVSKGETRVSVKVGYLLGDQDAARRILSEVEGRIAGAKADSEDRKRRWPSGGTGAAAGIGTTTSTTAPRGP